MPSDLKGAGVWHFSQIDFRCAAAIKNRDSEPETPFWHPAGTRIDGAVMMMPENLIVCSK
jgi:hypothetical protein